MLKSIGMNETMFYRLPFNPALVFAKADYSQ